MKDSRNYAMLPLIAPLPAAIDFYLSGRTPEVVKTFELATEGYKTDLPKVRKSELLTVYSRMKRYAPFSPRTARNLDFFETAVKNKDYATALKYLEDFRAVPPSKDLENTISSLSELENEIRTRLYNTKSSQLKKQLQKQLKDVKRTQELYLKELDRLKRSSDYHRDIKVITQITEKLRKTIKRPNELEAILPVVRKRLGPKPLPKVGIITSSLIALPALATAAHRKDPTSFASTLGSFGLGLGAGYEYLRAKDIDLAMDLIGKRFGKIPMSTIERHQKALRNAALLGLSSLGLAFLAASRLSRKPKKSINKTRGAKRYERLER